MKMTSTGSYADKGIAALAVVVLISVLAVALARMSGYEPVAPDNGTVIASCRLGFEDAASGAVIVFDWDSGATLEELAPGEGSFVRGVLRSLVRERRSRGLSADQPFRITRFSNGSLTLQDKSTGRRIELQAFGPSNAEAFARLLDASGAAS
jgi:putative photosynthetic complex assembly protein